MRSQGAPILDLEPPAGHDAAKCSGICSTRSNAANADHLATRGDNTDLAARIASYELAYKMQQHAPGSGRSVARNRRATQKLYGLDNDRDTQDFGQRCLLARRLVERGVRFVQLYSGGNHNDANWDAHGDLEKNHNFHAGNTDQPIAALIQRSQAARPAR